MTSLPDEQHGSQAHQAVCVGALTTLRALDCIPRSAKVPPACPALVLLSFYLGRRPLGDSAGRSATLTRSRRDRYVKNSCATAAPPAARAGDGRPVARPLSAHLGRTVTPRYRGQFEYLLHSFSAIFFSTRGVVELSGKLEISRICRGIFF